MATRSTLASVTLAVMTFAASAAAQDEPAAVPAKPAKATPKPAKADPKPAKADPKPTDVPVDAGATATTAPASKPGEGDKATPAAPLPDDLRAGHVLIYAGGGFSFLPNALVPLPAPTRDVGLGGGAQLTLGVGLNRYLVLGLDGQFGYAGLGGDGCDGCTLMSFGGGLGLTFHPTQAFAFDPWIRYAAGYRHSIASYEPLAAGGDTSSSDHAVDLAKISLGGDFYPDAAFGFGPYLETDVGLNQLDTNPRVYAVVHLGLRLAFDPVRAGTRIQPGTLTATAR